MILSLNELNQSLTHFLYVYMRVTFSTVKKVYFGRYVVCPKDAQCAHLLVPVKQSCLRRSWNESQTAIELCSSDSVCVFLVCLFCCCFRSGPGSSMFCLTACHIHFHNWIMCHCLNYVVKRTPCVKRV